MATKAHILLVEDDQFILRVYQKKLENSGYQVSVATNGEEALMKMNDLHPSIVLLDLLMPRKDGFEVIDAMQKNEDIKSIPVVVLTNLGQQRDIKRLEGKVAAYLLKANTSIQDVVEKVGEVLEGKSLT